MVGARGGGTTTARFYQEYITAMEVCGVLRVCWGVGGCFCCLRLGSPVENAVAKVTDRFIGGLWDGAALSEK